VKAESNNLLEGSSGDSRWFECFVNLRQVLQLCPAQENQEDAADECVVLQAQYRAADREGINTE
jgi:hypothetical protein